MGKVMTTFRRAEVREQGPDPAPRRLDRAFGGVAEQRFELSEDLFNRVEIGRIRRQEAQRGPRSLKGPAHSRALVAAEIVHNDDIARGEGREQALLHIGQEPQAVDRAIEDTGGNNAVVAQGGHERQGLPVAIRPRSDQPLAAGAAAVAPGHIGLGPRLINEHEPTGIKPALSTLPAGAVLGDLRPLLLGGRETFF